jgi:BlaI family penicillinase repressor
MARPASGGLTPREAQIMEVLWTEGPSPADRIREALPDRPHDSTVRTLLRILETKGCVKHSVQGKAYVYRAAVKKAIAERKAVNSLLQRFFGGSAEALVLRLIEDEKLTAEQLEQLKNASGRADKGAVGDQRGAS